MAPDSVATPSGLVSRVAERGLGMIAVKARDALEEGADGGAWRVARHNQRGKKGEHLYPLGWIVSPEVVFCVDVCRCP